jgi:hypothetical protein
MTPSNNSAHTPGRFIVYSPAAGEVHGEFRYSHASEKADAERRAKACRLAAKAKGYARVGITHRTALTPSPESVAVAMLGSAP